MIRRRPIQLLLALLLTTVVLTLGSASFQAKLQSFQPVGFTFEAWEGTWRISEVHGAVEFQVGDEILLVRGERLESAERLQQQLTGSPLTDVLVKRGDSLEAVTYQRPRLQIDFSYLGLAAIGILYLLIGLYTLFKDRKGQAWLFFLWCLTSTALFALSPPAQIVQVQDRLIFIGDQVARILLPALTLHLFLVFPTPLLRGVWHRRVLAVYAPSLVLLAFHVDQMLGSPYLFGAPSLAKLDMVSRLELLFLVFCSLVAAVCLAMRLAWRQDWEQRRQVQWLLLGMLGGFVPFLLLYVVPYSLHLAWPAWTTLAAVLPLALIPLTFAWAILRYKMLDFGLILRDSLSFGLTALVGLFAFSLIHTVLRSGMLGQLPLGQNFVTFAAGLAVAGALVPTRGAIASGLERLQYRGLLGQRRMLDALGQELLYERDLDRLCSLLTERLEEGLIIRTCLYLNQGGAMVPVRPDDDVPRHLGFDTLGPELWQRQVASLSGIGLPGGDEREQKLFKAGLRYAFPLTVRGHRIGLLLVSYKIDQHPLNSEDIDLIRHALNQGALAIENAQLLEEVHRKLLEVTQLEARNQGILESSPAGIAVLDPDDCVVSANHAFAALVGRPRPEVVGQPMADLVPVTPLPEPSDGLMEVSYCEADGTERYLQLSLAHYAQDGRQDGLRVLIIQDTSERMAMELELQEKERMAALGMLAAGVAHEVNTPLTGISSYAQMLLGDIPEDAPQHEMLKKIEKQTFRASQIVNNLLEFSRNRRDELSNVSLSALVDESLGLLDERLMSSQAQLEWQRPSDPFLVRGNESEIHQVVTNLVVNALDAMAQGDRTPPEQRQVRVHLEVLPRRFRIQVSDSGPGIPQERLERIFHPFFSSKSKQGGTGLGLAICHNIVRRHGGEILAENHSDGPGCTFRVELPRPDTI